MKRLAWLLFALWLPGCALEPSKDDPYQPFPEYRAWWAEVQGCSGRFGDFNKLQFYVLEPASRYAGRRFGDKIWIREAYVFSRRVVEHEMLHVLLDGDHDHRGWQWQACGLYPMTVGQALEGT